VSNVDQPTGLQMAPALSGGSKVFPAAVFPIRQDGEVAFTVSRLVRPWRDLPPWLNMFWDSARGASAPRAVDMVAADRTV
jgi:hypothetical protein